MNMFVESYATITDRVASIDNETAMSSDIFLHFRLRVEPQLRRNPLQSEVQV